MELNTDRSVCRNSSQAGAGGVVRDANGNWIEGFGRKLRQVESLMAEFWALREGLNMALDLGIHSIMLEPDARATLHLLDENSVTNPIYLPHCFGLWEAIQDVPEVQDRACLQ